MAEIKQTGVKISQYQTAEANNSKLILDHYLISYAPAYFGTSTINKNFKIPVSLLREDITGYIGISNTKPSWRETIKVWSGEWESSNPTNSYVYSWTEEDKITHKDDYIENKHANEDGIDKLFIINNAPLPQTEEENLDPNPSTKKIVTKSYIDNRFNGVPKVKCTSSTLEIRSYPCLYEFEMESVANIDIVDTLVKDTLTDKCVEFMLRIPTDSLFYEIGEDIPAHTDFSVSHNGTPCTWGYRNEILMMVSRAKNENTKNVWVRCFAEYVDGVFTVKCTNGLNVLEDEVITGAAGVVTEIDEVYNGKEVPTEEAVVNYVHLHTDKDYLHVTQDDKDLWNTTATNHIKDISLKSEYLTKVEIEGEETPNVFNLGLKTTDSITKSPEAKNSKAIPTTEAVISFVEELEKNVQGKIDSINGTLETIPSSLDSSFNVKGLVVEQVDGVITKVEVNNASFDKEKNELVESTKDNVITGTEVQNLIDTVLAKFAEVGVNYKIADDLPSPNETHKGWVYLIPKSAKATQNEYVEFICVDKDNDTWAWEQIGTTKADLTDYIKEEEFSKKIEEINNAINAIETKVEYEYNTENETLKGSTQKMNFRGKYVQLVENADGSIDLIFGPNNNPPSFSSITSPTTSALYVYKPADDTSYTFPSNQSGDVQYTFCSPNTSNQVIYLNGNGVEISNKKDFTLTCTLSRLNVEGNIELKIENINGSQSSYTVEDDTKSLKVELTDVVKNTLENNPDGTPGFIRYKGKITINQSKLAPNGDWYTLTVSDGETSKSSVQIFAYKPTTNSNTPTFDEYNTTFESSDTRTVSGISYYNTGTINTKVYDIKGTQNQITSDKNRLQITFSDANVSNSVTSKKYTSDELEVTSGSIDNENAVFSMKDTLSSTVKTTNNVVSKVNTTITACAGQQSGFNSGSTKTVTTSSYVWTKPDNTNDTALKSNFTEDGSYRKLGYINSSMKLVLNGDYTKTSKLSATDYTTQLLVQGGKLKHPKKDTTEEYKSLTGKRYYVRTISFSGSDRIYTFNIKIGSGITNTFPSGVKMYLAKDETTDIQELTAAKNKGHNGCSESDNPSSGTWTVAPAGKFEVFGGTTYYFIIEIDENSTAELGTLTITQ